MKSLCTFKDATEQEYMTAAKHLADEFLECEACGVSDDGLSV